MPSNWRIQVETPPYVMLSSDYSQQEPKLTAFVSKDPKMCDAFQHGKDIYATIASISFNLPYEKCLEFHPETHEYQPDGKARRSEAKLIVLGICYGRSVITIAEQLFGTDTSLNDEQKVAKAQKVYDSVLNAFPNLRQLMTSAQATARRYGYVETILGRRRHIPDMQLPEFEFVPMPGYVNPDIDPLDVSTLSNKEAIPSRIVKQLEVEFHGFKYFGQIARRTRELAEQKIRVINNRPKITEASRKCVNCVSLNTEIYTGSGWKRYDELTIGEPVLTYNLQTRKVERDTLLAVTVSHNFLYTLEFDNDAELYAVCTPDHRWVVQDSDQLRFATAQEIMNASDKLRIVTSDLTSVDASTVRITPSISAGVWCPTTGNGTWIARHPRREGCPYITGNSIIQGSAAELTKMAMLALEADPDWKRIGGRMVLPVHDELIVEVPIDYWEEGGKILSRVMSEAGSFLPFDISCDVTTTVRWYGLEYPCKYTRPSDWEAVEPEEVKWIQYHLVEMEYLLPVFKEADGSKPRGDAAVGVNGKITDEYTQAIFDYCHRYNISPSEFIDHIDNKVTKGV